jgi:lipopolysaccharide/colanic/teichoic acid biosynthesis glycosyltransferase
LLNDFGLASRSCFVRMLHVEQKRTERSGKCLALMLLEFGGILTASQYSRAVEKLLSALTLSTRETDIKGWYKDRSTLGIVFTEIQAEDAKSVTDVLLKRFRGLLAANLAGQANQVQISIQIFPQNWDGKGPDSTLPAEFRGDHDQRKSALAVKRSLDIVGSLCAITLFSPLFVAISIAIKLTSKGPVLFRQQRVGQYGRGFKFLKFRSMYVDNNQAIHQEFVKDLISGAVARGPNQKTVYKLTNDPRITPIGRFLRRTSLDELPQFLNVLKGEMSLVGPRPPIPYEVEVYEQWHRRRLLAAKPGITGLWQVTGRSRTTFDEMVRLDLLYARTWSVWMDLRILLQTPRAMVSGDGAH